MARQLVLTLARLVRRLAAAVGIEIRRAGAGGDDPFAALASLLAHTDVSVILDIGANRGDTVAKYRTLFPAAMIHAFEPNPAVADKLESRFAADRMIAVHRVAIGAERGVRRLNLYRSDQTNSLLAAVRGSDAYFDPELTAPLGAIEVSVQRLDDVVLDLGIKTVDLLKVDVQGGEGDVLRGASRLLSSKQARLLYLEVLIAPLYEGQSGLPDIAAILDGAGYRCYGLYDLRRGRNGSLVQLDAIYVHPAIEEGLGRRW